MYKYLLWDVDGTVLDFLAAEAYAIRTLFKKYNIGECTDKMLKRYSAINAEYWRKLENNELTKEEILIGRFHEFFNEIGADTEIAEDFNRDYQETLGDCVVFIENAKELLLSKKGKYTIAAVTNGTRVAQEKKLKNSGLDKIFDAVFISENIGSEKPNKAFFDYVFEKLGICDKKEVLIIGDSLSGDMRGGFNYGIDTCWFNPSHNENTLNIPVTYEIAKLCEIENIVKM
ncbi:MAG: noncanonical pyrimidine nucleotidase, YjjG family [Ruminococcaceae bacterium]|nr:noncanonical pyrimidine nucleotidase, YjjG family [Oscillospiraceae bacterium]